MTRYIWEYACGLGRTTGDGTLELQITPPKNVLIKPIYLSVKSFAGDNAGGTSLTTITFEPEDSSSPPLTKDYVTGSPAGTVTLPDSDIVYTFGKLPLDSIWLGHNDTLVLQRTYMNNATGAVQIYCRFLMSGYAIPTLAIGTNMQITSTLYSRIIGVIDERG